MATSVSALITLFLPLAGALLLRGDRAASRQVGAGDPLLVLGLAAVLVAAYPGGERALRRHRLVWLGWTSAPRSTSASALPWTA